MKERKKELGIRKAFSKLVNTSAIFSFYAILTLTLFFIVPGSSWAGTVNLPQTGQATCYDESGNVISCTSTGQDGEIQAGVAWPLPRFTDNGNGTVTDNLTGLVWTKNANLPGSAMTWQQALDYVAGLNSSAYLGYTDWRLPNFNELTSIIDWGRSGPSLPVNNPFINVKQGGSELYWSSTSYGSFTALLWSFNTWTISHNSKLGNGYVWPIRSGVGGIIQLPKTGQTLSYAIGDDGDLEIGIVWPSPRVTDNGDGTVTDNLTGLVWTKDANLPGSAMTWQQALDYVAALNSSAYLGYTDWRLPNINELKSLIDRGRWFPSLPSNHPFINVQNYVYWSATTATFGNYSSTNEALTIYVGSDGNLVANNKPENYYVWPVRAGQFFNLPDTGQTTCYDAVGTIIPCPAPGDPMAQDGSYNINPPSYTDNGNGTVTDNVTGFMWQQQDDNLTYNWYEASGTYDATYNPVSTDVCGSLSLGGYSDWRLPSKKELITIVNYGTYNPAIDTTYFPNTNVSSYWSSTTDVPFPSQAWRVPFFDGVVGPYDKSYSYYVRCVRGGQYPTQSFADNGNGTVTDSTTGLMWQQDEGGSLDWESALTYCEELSLAGYSDWRLPNIKELESITDDTKNNTTIETTYFPNANASYHWSSTTHVYYSSRAWYVNFYFGDVYFFPKSNSYDVRCVRGGGNWVNSIMGTVILGGSGLNGVTMALSGTTSGTTLTATDGSYSFTGLADGPYTITPSLTGYTFNPVSIDVTISGTSVTGQDFRACNTSIPLSGTLRDATTNTALSGVTVTVDGLYSDVTDSNGNYSISGLSCGAHTLTVSVPSGYSGYSRTMDTFLTTTWDVFLTKPETVYGGDTNSGYSSDPVNTATGNYIYQKKDLEIPGRGMPFIFERNYNSQDAQDGPLGFGWNHNYNTALTVNADSTVTIRWGDGKTETWTPDGLGGFSPQYGVFDDLIDNGDGTYTLNKKDLTLYNFDTSGRLLNIVDKNHNTISLTYTGGNLAQITDTAGRNIDFTYDANNRITTITDPIGRTIQFAYDANGDLVSSIDMNVNTTTYTYDPDHQILTVVDPRGNTVVSNVYDDEKRVVMSQRDAKGGYTTYTYDEINRKTTLVDAMGYTTVHYHDELLRLIQEDDDPGNSAHYTYDSAGNRTDVEDKNSTTTTYTYDSNGNVFTKTDALANVTTITYDSNNNPLTRTDALGNITVFEYDANGNLIKTTDPLGNFTTITYDTYGQPLTITDNRGNTSTNIYDVEGNLIEVTDAIGNNTTYTYDGVGRRLTETDALGRTTTYTYDNNDNLLTVTGPLVDVTTYTYDENNNKLTVTEPMSNTTSYTYDVKDLLTSITDPLGNAITNAYDGLDRKTAVTDKRGNTTAYAYDSVGNLITMTDALGNSTTYTYDANGNKLTETNPLGQTVTYTYDALDRVVSTTDPVGNTMTNNYDALGRITATTNAKGQTTGFEYDAKGKLTKVTDFNGGIVNYTYDENGNRLTMTEPNGNTTSYAYDPLNRLIQKKAPLGSTYQYAYDAAGNRTSLTDADGNTMNYTYDANNRLTTNTYPDTSTVTFTYDANGNRTQMVDSLRTNTYTYDALNRMTLYADPYGKTIGYGYDANGNRTSLTYPDGNIVAYTYDAMNRITTVTDWLTNATGYSYDVAGNLAGTSNPNNTATTYTYDDAGRLTGLSNTRADSTVISSYSYTLDAIGNHTSVMQDEPLPPMLTSRHITYTYDAENRLTNVGGTTYIYDANGNLTSKGSDTFTYDYEDRLIESSIGGVTTQYNYDGFGNRLSKIEGITTTKYVLDINGSLSNVIAETDDSGTITAYYVYGLGLIAKVLPDNTAYYYHYDSRGSTVALSDASENLTDKYAYDTFGNIVNSNGTTENPFKYVGRYGVMEEGNGLNYIRTRYYAPEFGRFITKDPVTGKDGDSQSLNRYVYALNNPVILIDISGFSALEGGAGQNNSGSSDIYHSNQIGDNDKKIRKLLSEWQIAANLAYELQEIEFENWINILVALKEAGSSATGGVIGIFTGGPLGGIKGAATGILQQASTLAMVAGRSDISEKIDILKFAVSSAMVLSDTNKLNRMMDSKNFSLLSKDFGIQLLKTSGSLKNWWGSLNNVPISW